LRKVVVLLILSLYLLAPPIPTSRGPETPSSYSFAPLGGTDYPWTMFHHDSQRTGATPASAPSTPSLMWSFNTGATVYSSAAVDGGEQLRPVAAHYDETEEFPWDVFRKAAEAGLTCYDLPEEYGGGGVASVLTSCLILEELAWGDSSIAGCARCRPVRLPAIRRPPMRPS